MSESERSTPRRSGSSASLIFGALAVALAVAAVALFVRDRGEEAVPTAPAAAPGQNEVVHVVNALKREGLAVEISRDFIPRGVLGVPGQGMTVDGVPLFVFIYAGTESAAAARTEAERVDPAAVLARAAHAGTPTAGGEPYLTNHSNVTVLLVGGSEELRSTVDGAIAGLP